MKRRKLCIVFFLIIATSCHHVLSISAKNEDDKKDTFHEDLFISRLKSNHLLTRFVFLTKKFNQQDSHYDLFPKLIGELAHKYGVQELSVSLSSGLWRTNVWDEPPQPAAPTGALLYAWFKDDVKDVDKEWGNVVEALSGLLCASLAQLNPRLTVQPKLTLRPSGFTNRGTVNRENLRYALLPYENVCTENMTPWKKLLPCKESGLAMLLNGHRIFETHYTAMSLHLTTTCQEAECRNVGWELMQTMDLVFDAPLWDRKGDWTLRELFQIDLHQECSLATGSEILIDTSSGSPGGSSAYKFNIEPSRRQGDLVVYDLKEIAAAEREAKEVAAAGKKQRMSLVAPLSVKVDGKLVFNDVPPPNVTLYSFVGGLGRQDGKLYSRIFNNDAEYDLKLFYNHMIPWYLKMYWHSLRFNCQPLKATHTDEPQWDRHDPVFSSYTPGRDRKSPHFIELALTIPRQHVCEVVVEFERVLLGWTEYPPDAHRGFSVPPPSIIYRAKNGMTNTIWGQVSLVSLPTPDFSMPYNVICLVCTVVALAFGPLHNLTCMSLVLTTDEELTEKTLKRKLQRVFHTQLMRFRRWRRNGLLTESERDVFLTSLPKAERDAASKLIKLVVPTKQTDELKPGEDNKKEAAAGKDDQKCADQEDAKSK